MCAQCRVNDSVAHLYRKEQRGDCLTSIRRQMAELASINYNTYACTHTHTHTPVTMRQTKSRHAKLDK